MASQNPITKNRDEDDAINLQGQILNRFCDRLLECSPQGFRADGNWRTGRVLQHRPSNVAQTVSPRIGTLGSPLSNFFVQHWHSYGLHDPRLLSDETHKDLVRKNGYLHANVDGE